MTRTRLYAVAAGGGLTAAGLIGLFVNNDFSTGAAVTRGAVLGLLDTNGWHNLTHLIIGPLGLLIAARVGAAAGAYALTAGVWYAVIAGLGFALGSEGAIFDRVAVNTLDNVIHLGLGVTGLLAAWSAAGRGARRPARPAPEAAPGV